MTLREFITRYHGATAAHLADELFNESIGDDQDLTYPNNYIMLLTHEINKLKQEIETLKQRNDNE
jgi:hypothetical protein